MKRIELELKPDSEIIIKRCGGSLHLKGWDQEKARIDFPHNEDNYSQKGNQVIISSTSDCLMRVPTDVLLKVEKVGGDASVSNIAGAISIQAVNGNVTLRRIGSAAAERISGNLTARDLSGDFNVQRVNGNTTLRNIQGALIAEDVSGNLSIREAGPRVEAKAGGNANLRLSLSSEADYQISCGGNAYCRIEGSIDAKVSLKSGGRSIFLHTEDGSQNLDSETHELSFGNGKSSLNIDAGGDIDFRSKEVLDEFRFSADIDFADDFGGMVEDISDQVGAQMEAQLEALNSQLESLSERMQSSGDKAVRRAQKKVEAAQRSLENRLRARNLGARGRGPKSSGTGFIFTHSAEPVSEEERMKVLQMVQEKKISVDEAEILLATLEGRETPTKGKDKES
jgi:hypothetical protein